MFNELIYKICNLILKREKQPATRTLTRNRQEAAGSQDKINSDKSSKKSYKNMSTKKPKSNDTMDEAGLAESETSPHLKKRLVQVKSVEKIVYATTCLLVETYDTRNNNQVVKKTILDQYKKTQTLKKNVAEKQIDYKRKDYYLNKMKDERASSEPFKDSSDGESSSDEGTIPQQNVTNIAPSTTTSTQVNQTIVQQEEKLVDKAFFDNIVMSKQSEYTEEATSSTPIVQKESKIYRKKFLSNRYQNSNENDQSDRESDSTDHVVKKTRRGCKTTNSTANEAEINNKSFKSAKKLVSEEKEAEILIDSSELQFKTPVLRSSVNTFRDLKLEASQQEKNSDLNEIRKHSQTEITTTPKRSTTRDHDPKRTISSITITKISKSTTGKPRKSSLTSTLDERLQKAQRKNEFFETIIDRKEKQRHYNGVLLPKGLIKKDLREFKIIVDPIEKSLFKFKFDEFLKSNQENASSQKSSDSIDSIPTSSQKTPPPSQSIEKNQVKQKQTSARKRTLPQHQEINKPTSQPTTTNICKIDCGQFLTSTDKLADDQLVFALYPESFNYYPANVVERVKTFKNYPTPRHLYKIEFLDKEKNDYCNSLSDNFVYDIGFYLIRPEQLELNDILLARRDADNGLKEKVMFESYYENQEDFRSMYEHTFSCKVQNGDAKA